jgi:acetyl-CoA/propionyl-CoA carboxylase biotin carboxyl carrier protein
MLAKVIAHGADRATALRTLDQALADTAVLGVTTNVEFLRFLLADPDVVAGRLDTGLLDRRVTDFKVEPPTDHELIAGAAYQWVLEWQRSSDDLWTQPSGWRVSDNAPTTMRLRAGDRIAHVHLTGHPGAAVAAIEDGESRAVTAKLDGSTLTITLGGVRRRYSVAADSDAIWLATRARTVVVNEVQEEAVRPDDEHSGDVELTSPMPGTVVAVSGDSGTSVNAGTVVVTVEAMKMEHALTTPIDGVAELLVAVGDQVTVGQALARITAHEREHD